MCHVTVAVAKTHVCVVSCGNHGMTRNSVWRNVAAWRVLSVAVMYGVAFVLMAGGVAIISTNVYRSHPVRIFIASVCSVCSATYQQWRRVT